MHSADVAEYVWECVNELRVQLALRPELEVSTVDLADNVNLDIGFTKSQWGALRTSRTHTDPFTRQQFPHEELAIDLGARRSRDLVLRLNLKNYDFDPPTAELLTGEREPLPTAEWPKAIGSRGIIDEHPDYPRPFFCRRGFREYHSHFQHEDDPWDAHREGLALHTSVIELLDDLRLRWML